MTIFKKIMTELSNTSTTLDFTDIDLAESTLAEATRQLAQKLAEASPTLTSALFQSNNLSSICDKSIDGLFAELRPYFTSLHFIYLRDNQLGLLDYPVRHCILSELAHFTKLRYIDLSENKLGQLTDDELALLFARIATLPDLLSIDLHANDFNLSQKALIMQTLNRESLFVNFDGGVNDCEQARFVAYDAQTQLRLLIQATTDAEDDDELFNVYWRTISDDLREAILRAPQSPAMALKINQYNLHAAITNQNILLLEQMYTAMPESDIEHYYKMIIKSHALIGNMFVEVLCLMVARYQQQQNPTFNLAVCLLAVAIDCNLHDKMRQGQSVNDVKYRTLHGVLNASPFGQRLLADYVEKRVAAMRGLSVDELKIVVPQLIALLRTDDGMANSHVLIKAETLHCLLHTVSINPTILSWLERVILSTVFMNCVPVTDGRYSSSLLSFAAVRQELTEEVELAQWRLMVETIIDKYIEAGIEFARAHPKVCMYIMAYAKEYSELTQLLGRYSYRCFTVAEIKAQGDTIPPELSQELCFSNILDYFETKYGEVKGNENVEGNRPWRRYQQRLQHFCTLRLFIQATPIDEAFADKFAAKVEELGRLKGRTFWRVVPASDDRYNKLIDALKMIPPAVIVQRLAELETEILARAKSETLHPITYLAGAFTEGTASTSSVTPGQTSTQADAEPPASPGAITQSSPTGHEEPALPTPYNPQ